jgi:NADH:ubiquinone oxidoreductase subunit 3 (subunit A)
VVVEMPYEPNILVTRLECISYLQKKVGARLKRPVKEKLGTNLHDGKTLGSNGRLTQSEIDKLQNYYGLAIRRIVNNLEAMMRAAWAIFFTSCQQMRNPNMFIAQMVMTVGGN